MTCFIPHEQIDEYWSYIAHWIGQACEFANGKYTTDSVLDMLHKKDAQLWVYGTTAAGITQIIDYPCRRVAIVLFAGGKSLDGFKESLEVVEGWARLNGCDAVEIIGRPAWQKVLPEYGLEHIYLVKNL